MDTLTVLNPNYLTIWSWDGLSVLLAGIDTPIPAGFPSPAEGFAIESINLSELIIHNSEATFLAKVKGDSMEDMGLKRGDVFIIDRSLECQHGDIIVAIVDGECTVKRLWKKGRQIRLVPENSNYQPIVIEEHHRFEIWGKVTWWFKSTTGR